MIEPTKPGWQTTEFWTTLLAQIIGVAVILRIVPEADAATLTSQVVAVVQGVFATIATVGSLFLYIRSRTQVKGMAIQETAAVEIARSEEAVAKSEERLAMRSTERK